MRAALNQRLRGSSRAIGVSRRPGRSQRAEPGSDRRRSRAQYHPAILSAPRAPLLWSCDCRAACCRWSRQPGAMPAQTTRPRRGSGPYAGSRYGSAGVPGGVRSHPRWGTTRARQTQKPFTCKDFCDAAGPRVLCTSGCVVRSAPRVPAAVTSAAGGNSGSGSHLWRAAPREGRTKGPTPHVWRAAPTSEGRARRPTPLP